jgi:secreted trypsin-like serine protease
VGSAAHRIRNGTCVTSGFENVVRLGIVTNVGTFLCSGTLIAANVVLSAGHCVNPASQSPPMSVSQIVVDQPNTKVGAFVTHYAFTGGAKSQSIVSTVDMSVLRLDRNFAATPATIAAQDPAVGQQMIALGYGFDGNAADGDGNSGDLLSGLVVIDFPGSSSKNIRTIAAVQPISEPNSQDTCGGDSGGPLFATNATNTVVGMLSGGNYVGIDTCKNSADSYWTPARWNSTQINNWKNTAQGLSNGDPAPIGWTKL